MDLLQMVLAATQNNAVDKLASQHNLSSNQASDVLSQLLPELGSRIQGNIKQEIIETTKTIKITRIKALETYLYGF